MRYFFAALCYRNICAFVLMSFSLWAYSQTETALDFHSEPPVIAESSTPMVLLALSNDHQLFFKSYSDYDDLTGDGVAETTYTHSVDYVGYFDSYKCYSYSVVDGRFNPVSATADKYCSGNWSGNFLNWATMTRMDQIRKVLYGGYRSTDTSSLTVLERSFLVNDAHSFAKYYDGTDIENLTPYNPTNQGLGTIESGMTFCNTTYVASGDSQNIDTSTNPPLLRIAEGNYSLWAAGERFQCRFSSELSGKGNNGNNPSTSGINAYSSSPATKIADLNVRVSVCVSGLEEEDCKKYPTSSHQKPTGVLQTQGDDEDIYFGLLTGSYAKNKSGGVLRKNIGTFTDEVNVTTDGTFKAVPSGGGIVNTLDLFRLARYRFDDGRYNVSDSCSWGQSSFVDGNCTNWGNPFAEIMLECYRYFADSSATPDFAANDTTILPGLTTATWSSPNPVGADNACSQLSIIAFNASTTSYDADQLSGVSALNTGDSTDELTDDVGDHEGITGNEYFVGESDASTNQLCTGKTVAGLGGVRGTCPDSPRLSGSYHAAGLAFHASQTDIRPDLEGSQFVDTYAVSLAPAVPSATIPVPSSDGVIQVLPACRNTSVGGNCAIVDFKVLQVPTESGGVVTAGYYVNWEDSEFGGDYDQDMHGVIGVVVTPTQVTVTTNVIGQSTGYRMGFGYVIAGTTADSFYAQSGINGYSESECSGGCTNGNAAESRTYTIGTSSASLLESPLFYTAKYGGFNDLDGDGVPSSTDEWDVKDTAGNFAPDGFPDNYFPVTNPLQLKESLDSLFDLLKGTLVSSSAAAVVANTSSGEGAIFQAAYYPKYQISSTESINWPGLLHAVFRDENGYFREDTNGNAQLDDYGTDYRVTFYYSEALEQTRAVRYTGDEVNGFTVLDEKDFEDFESIWNARDRLGDLTTAQVTAQRSYNALASTGRYIITGLDLDNDGTVETSETLSFDESAFLPSSNDYHRYMALEDAEEDKVGPIIRFVRGEEGVVDPYTNVTYRSRAIDYDGDGADEIWRLGDLIHSAPTSVSIPRARYDSRYSDETYSAYRVQYANRRQVIYAGGNDGMLHAFNAGFYDSSTKSFKLSSTGSEVQHPLGSELWAYVPMSSLPHLQWLTSPDYKHVYYVDGSPRVYDVNIFDDDDDHPNGWGTILVMGMRFGGSEINLDTDGDAAYGEVNGDVTTRPGFLIFDVTNPEKEPVLLGEIMRPVNDLLSVSLTFSGDGYTSAPDVNISGDGDGASATAILADTGSIAELTINDGGKGYSVGNSISLSGDGSGAVLRVTSVDSDGAITGAVIDSAGSGYSSVSITANQSLIDADITLSVNGGGNINAVNIDDGGSGYTVGDVINIDSDCTDAPVATVSSVSGGGVVQGVTLTGGSGCSYATVDSIDRSAYQTADITGVIGYVIDSIEIASQGVGYTNATISIDPSDTGSTATASAVFTSVNWGYTTSRPVVVKRRTPDSTGSYDTPSQNDWYLVFGSGPSGPDGLDDAVSDDAGQILFYNLNDMSFEGVQEFDSNAFSGHLAAIDWNDDFTDDAIYFGTSEYDGSNFSGELKRLSLDFDSISSSPLMTFLDADSPIIETPRLTRDTEGKQWVHFGAGRFLVSDDNAIASQQHYYGVIEPNPVASVSISGMIDVTDIQIFTEDPDSISTVNYVRSCEAPCVDGGTDTVIDGETIETWQELRQVVASTEGWYRELDLHDFVTDTSTSRVVGASNLIGTTLLFGEYAPSTDECSPIGWSRVNAYHFQTGTASPFAPIGLGSSTYNTGTYVETDAGINNSLTLLGGDGQGNSDDSEGSGVSVDDHGVLGDVDVSGEPAPFGRQSWREININWDSGL